MSRRQKVVMAAIYVAFTLVLLYGLAQIPLAEWTWVDYFFAILYGASLAFLFAAFLRGEPGRLIA